ncbi:MAG: hypothetical protein JW929_15770 [Anaerolineales bacterium]|nr:hypothetical protein [Anaerolineales bacterium]
MMKKLLLIAFVLFPAGCVPQPETAAPPSPIAPSAVGPESDFAQIDLGEGLYVRQIRPDAFVVTHSFPWPANSLIAEMENSDLVLAGTPYTPEAMEAVLKWIRGKFGGRNIVAVNPGYHVDNLGGNGALIAAGIPVYGSGLTAELLADRGEQTRKYLLEMLAGPADARFRQAHAEIPYLPPDHLFSAEDGLTLSFGEEQVQAYWPGPTQAPDKLAVYFPGKRILFGSCMVLGGHQVGNTREADMENWPKAIEALKRFGADFVVPGHGSRLDPGLLDHTIALLDAAAE